MDTMKKTLLKLLFGISLLGFFISLYLLYLHYAPTSSFCNFGDKLNCDVVNKSDYAEFPPGFGIPVALFGSLFFLFILFCIFRVQKGRTLSFGKKKLNEKGITKLMVYATILSLCFAFYLVLIEIFVLHAFCVLCLLLDILLILMLVLLLKLRTFKASNSL